VFANAFSAVREEMLFRTVSAIGVSPYLPLLRLHSAFCVGPALRLPVVEKEVILDKQSIGSCG
jgi:hypothetical protein